MMQYFAVMLGIVAALTGIGCLALYYERKGA